jgi:Glu-tRNA(Gln) amidotransferase subunit E-like FAD-binding protein
MALDGVPQETRRLLPDGNSEFLRVIHGKERIYPDTDTPPIVVSKSVIEECRKAVGKRPWEVYDDLHCKHGFSQSQVEFLAASGDAEKKRLFKEILQLSRVDRCYDRIKQGYDSEFLRATKFEGEIAGLLRTRDSINERIARAEEDQRNWEKEKEELNKEKEKLSKLAKLVKTKVQYIKP